MGQCVLREMGFDFEKDKKKQKMLDDYLRKKLKAKYPDAYRHRKPKFEDKENEGSWAINEPKSEQTKQNREQNKGLQMKRPRQFLSESNIDLTDGRLSKIKKAKVREMVIQTEDLEEDLGKSKIKSCVNIPTATSDYASSRRQTPLNLDNHSIPSLNGLDHQNLEGNQVASRKMSSSFIKNKSYAALNNGYGGVDTSLRMRSENSGTNMRLSGIGSQTNIFNGMERINFKEPVKPGGYHTGRSTNQIIKGFENKYFRVSRNRSPSPAGHERVFDDDEDFPYDEYL